MGSAISATIACAMARTSPAGTLPGTSGAHCASSSRVSAVASARFIPSMRGARAAAERRDPPQSGHSPSFRNRATRARPFSSFTLDNAFFTVLTAL